MRAFRRLVGLLQVLGIAVLATVVWISANHHNLSDLGEAWRQRQYYRGELARRQRLILELHQERMQLARGGFPAEKALRERFAYVRAGENLFQVQLEGERSETAGVLRQRDTVTFGASGTRGALSTPIEDAAAEEVLDPGMSASTQPQP